MKDNFAAFGDAIRQSDALKNAAVIKKYPAKAMILSNKDKSADVYFILEGAVDITSFSSQGREVWHNRLKAGQLFGEMSALTGEPRSANVTAVTATTTAIVRPGEFLKMIEKDTQMCFWLLQELASRLEQSTRQIYELVALNVSKRICAELVRRTRETPDANNEFPLTPSPVLAQLARQLNTDRETISRAISSLSKEGLLRKNGRQMTVINKSALIKRALE